jgi:hypothetical protein
MGVCCERGDGTDDDTEGMERRGTTGMKEGERTAACGVDIWEGRGNGVSSSPSSSSTSRMSSNPSMSRDVSRTDIYRVCIREQQNILKYNTQRVCLNEYARVGMHHVLWLKRSELLSKSTWVWMKNPIH